MAEVQPFHGIRYNQAVVRDLAAVICPPYDIITPQMEQELYNRNQYNFIRVEHAQQLLQDSTMDNRYTRSATTVEEWLKQGVLVTDTEPAIYIHDHYFIHKGREHKRRCLVARVRLEEWHRNIIRPHEGTLAEAKSDRLRLLWALKADTSPILVMYEDQDRYISSLLDDQELGKPIISIDGYDVERHKVWALTSPQAIQDIGGFFAWKPLYIADGHHRYESALNYQRDQHAIYASVSVSDAFNFVMMSLVAFDDPGLVILPPHRLIRGLPPSKLANLGSELKSFFDVEEMPLSLPNIWEKVDKLLADESEARLALFGLSDQNIWLATLKDPASASQMIPYFHSELYKRLSVSIVDHVILEEFLGLSSEDEVKISYNYDSRDTVKKVLKQEHQLALLVSPVSGRTIKEVSDAGDRMPRKSTYFYPKLPSGLVLNRLV